MVRKEVRMYFSHVLFSSLAFVVYILECTQLINKNLISTFKQFIKSIFFSAFLLLCYYQVYILYHTAVNTAVIYSQCKLVLLSLF
jgi:hypothetical protein